MRRLSGRFLTVRGSWHEYLKLETSLPEASILLRDISHGKSVYKAQEASVCSTGILDIPQTSLAVMLHEIALEAVRYFDRPTLEGLQMHSRYLRDMVNRHASTLPLRYIHDVWVRT